MRVGLIGLGNMGSGMAANLLKGGHEVTVYNRTQSKAQTLVAQGARHAAQVADACRGDAVITMLADDSAVESVFFGNATLQYAFNVIRLALRFQVIDDPIHFVVRHKSAVNPHRQPAARRHIEHVAHP